MEYRRFGNTIVARIDRGEEVLEQVAAIAQAEQIKLASVQALGAVGEFTVGVFHTAEKQYHANSFAGDFEIVSLTGTINTMDGAERAGSVEIPSADVQTLLTRYNDLGGSKQDLSVLMDKYPCTVEKAK